MPVYGEAIGNAELFEQRRGRRPWWAGEKRSTAAQRALFQDSRRTTSSVLPCENHREIDAGIERDQLAVLERSARQNVRTRACARFTDGSIPHSTASTSNGFTQSDGGEGTSPGTGCVLRRANVASTAVRIRSSDRFSRSMIGTRSTRSLTRLFAPSRGRVATATDERGGRSCRRVRGSLPVPSRH
jgi:hypothetical protein